MQHRLPGLCIAALVVFFAYPSNAGQQSTGSAARTSYRNDSRGLRQLAQDILKARTGGDEAAYALLRDSLLMPAESNWFVSVFGVQDGGRYAGEYQGIRKLIPQRLDQAFDEMIKIKFTVVQAIKFEESRDDYAGAHEYPVLALRLKQVPIFELAFLNQDYSFKRMLWAFAYVDGAFRYLGNLRAIEPIWLEADHSLPVVASEVQESRLISKVLPNYPQAAKNARIEGIVRLSALIDRAGNVEKLRVMEGHCWLAEEAVKAVMKWRYTPTLVSGEPSYVVATITVEFLLRRKSAEQEERQARVGGSKRDFVQLPS